MAAVDQSAAELDQLQQRLAQFGGNAAIQQELGRALNAATPHDARAVALRAMASSRVKAARTLGWHRWSMPCRAESQTSRNSPSPWPFRSVSPSASATDLQAALLRVARDSTRPTTVRLDALGSLGKDCRW